MKTLYAYREHDGLGVFTGQLIRAKASTHESLKPAPPEGCKFFEADSVDHFSQRLDLQSMKLVDYQPPQPDEQHAWNPTRKRWQLSENVLTRRAAREQVVGQLQAIDAKRSRALEDLLLAPNDPGTDGKLPKQRLQELRAQAETQREILRQNAEPVTATETGTSVPTL